MLVHELLLETEQEDGPQRAVKFTNDIKAIIKKHELRATRCTVKFYPQRGMQPAHYSFNVLVARRDGHDADEQDIQYKLARRAFDKWVKQVSSEFAATAEFDGKQRLVMSDTDDTIWLVGVLSLPMHQLVRPQLSFQVFGYVVPADLTEPLTGSYDQLHDGKKPPYPYFSTRLSTTFDNNGELLMVRRLMGPTNDLSALQRVAIELASRYAPALAGKQMAVRRANRTIPVSVITDEELTDGFPVINSVKTNDASSKTVPIPPAEFRKVFLRFFPNVHLHAK